MAVDADISDEKLRQIAFERGYRLVETDSLRTASAITKLDKAYLFRIPAEEHSKIVRRQLISEIAALISNDVVVTMLPGEADITYRAEFTMIGDIASPTQDDFYMRYYPKKAGH